jgi:hypothetical protein
MFLGAQAGMSTVGSVINVYSKRSTVSAALLEVDNPVRRIATVDGHWWLSLHAMTAALTNGRFGLPLDIKEFKGFADDFKLRHRATATSLHHASFLGEIGRLHSIGIYPQWVKPDDSPQKTIVQRFSSKEKDEIKQTLLDKPPTTLTTVD